MAAERKVIVSCTYNHAGLGPVHVRVHGTTRHVKARWVGQEVHITVPPHYPLEEYERFMEQSLPRLLEMRPPCLHYVGRVIDAPLADFTLVAGQPRRGHVELRMCSETPQRGKKTNYTVIVDGALAAKGTEGPAMQAMLNRALIAAATHATASLIVPHARELAAAIGHEPRGWDVKEARTRLGCCSSEGIINLSPRLIFLPEELSDFVIYHELAHLSEMNHSSAFHAVCDSYCGGREAEFRARLRKFRFPVF